MVLQKRIRIPLYNVQLVVYYGEFEELKKINDSLGYDEFLESSFGRSFWNAETNRFRLFLRSEERVSVGTIAHECKHMVNYIFKARGIILDVDNDEAECYLLEWLVNKIYSIIKN